MELKLKELREGKRYTQKELSEIMGINLGTYRNYEQGIREPSAETLVRFAEFYDTTVDYILGRPQKERPVIIKSETPESVARRLKNAFHNLTNKNRKKVADYAEDLLYAQMFEASQIIRLRDPEPAQFVASRSIKDDGSDDDALNEFIKKQKEDEINRQ